MRGDRTLEVEIAIRPAKEHRGGRSRKGEPEDLAPPAIPRIAKLMALAIKFQDMVDRVEVRDYADIARLGFVTRARLTQIMNLLNLAPDIQEAILFDIGGTPPRETRLRPIVQFICWEDQRRAFAGTYQSMGSDLPDHP
jgi:hypothetical protein